MSDSLSGLVSVLRPSENNRVVAAFPESVRLSELDRPEVKIGDVLHIGDQWLRVERWSSQRKVLARIKR